MKISVFLRGPWRATNKSTEGPASACSRPSKNHCVTEWSPYFNQRTPHRSYDSLSWKLILWNYLGHPVSPLTNLQPHKVLNYWTIISKATGNPLKALEPCLKIPAEVLLMILLLSTVVFHLFWRFPFRKRSMNQGQRRKENTGRRTQSCMEKHRLHAILRSCGTAGLELLCP